jgi:hypothetical protein
MTWVVTAVVGQSVIGAIGSIVAGHEQAGAQERAANTQAQMFNTIVGQEQPFLQAGYGATKSLSELLGFSKPTGRGGMASGTNLPGGYLTQQFAPTQAQLNRYPGYQFALQTGGQAVRNADTPGVGALSGPALKDLINFNVGTANQYYGQYFNQFQEQQNNIFNRLSTIANLGQSAASNQAQAGTTLGTGIAQAQAAAGASTAGSIVGATNALSNIPMNILMANQLGGAGGGGGGGGGGTPWYLNPWYTSSSGGMGPGPG